MNRKKLQDGLAIGGVVFAASGMLLLLLKIAGYSFIYFSTILILAAVYTVLFKKYITKRKELIVSFALYVLILSVFVSLLVVKMVIIKISGGGLVVK